MTADEKYLLKVYQEHGNWYAELYRDLGAEGNMFVSLHSGKNRGEAITDAKRAWQEKIHPPEYEWLRLDEDVPLHLVKVER